MTSQPRLTRPQRSSRKRLFAMAAMVLLLLTGCVVPDVIERPKTEPTQSEMTGCVKLAQYFPTWAYDGEPETVANRVDTEASVEEGLTFTGVFRAVCPGALPD